MNSNWHEVRQGLDTQLAMERRMAKLRRQRAVAAFKAKVANKAQNIVETIQFSLIHRFEEIR